MHLTCLIPRTEDRDVFAVGIDWKYEGKEVDPEYLVQPRYSDLKEEMLHYKYLDAEEVVNVFIKAEIYLNTNIAKSIKGGWKRHPFQVSSSIKKHNAGYYWFSRILKHVMAFYGQSADTKNGPLPKLHGPFYCGMSVVLNILEFNIFIRSPISTSVHLEVAMKVCAEYFTVPHIFVHYSISTSVLRRPGDGVGNGQYTVRL